MRKQGEQPFAPCRSFLTWSQVLRFPAPVPPHRQTFPGRPAPPFSNPQGDSQPSRETRQPRQPRRPPHPFRGSAGPLPGRVGSLLDPAEERRPAPRGASQTEPRARGPFPPPPPPRDTTITALLTPSPLPRSTPAELPAHSKVRAPATLFGHPGPRRHRPAPGLSPRRWRAPVTPGSVPCGPPCRCRSRAPGPH